MTYMCIKRQSMKIYKAGYSKCIIEKDVKVNIMRFRTLRSIEFQGLCSRNWNLSRSGNCNFGIYGPLAFYQWLTRVSKDSPWRYKAGYSRCKIEKDVKVNIMRFRTLRSIEFQGLCSRNWNFSRSENCNFGIYGPLAFYQWLTRVSKDSPWRYKAGYSRCINEKDVKVNIMRFRTWCSMEFQGLCRWNWNLPRSENLIFGIYGP